MLSKRRHWVSTIIRFDYGSNGRLKGMRGTEGFGECGGRVRLVNTAAELRSARQATQNDGLSYTAASFARLDRPHKTMACRTRPRASLGSTGHTKRWPVVHGRELRSARQATQNDGLSYKRSEGRE